MQVARNWWPQNAQLRVGRASRAAPSACFAGRAVSVRRSSTTSAGSASANSQPGHSQSTVVSRTGREGAARGTVCK